MFAAAAQCDVLLTSQKKWHIVKPGTAKQRKTEYRNTKSEMVKPGYEIPNPDQTVSSNR